MKELKEFDKKIKEYKEEEAEVFKKLNKKKAAIEHEYHDIFYNSITKILDIANSNGIKDIIRYLNEKENYIKNGITDYQEIIKAVDINACMNNITDSCRYADIRGLSTTGNHEMYMKDYETGMQFDDIELESLDVDDLYQVLKMLLTNPLVSAMINANSFKSLNEGVKNFKDFSKNI